MVEPPNSRTRLWRALLRVEKIDADGFHVDVPGWDGKGTVLIGHDKMLSIMRQNGLGGVRFHAMVNLGANIVEELRFEPQETQPEQSLAVPSSLQEADLLLHALWTKAVGTPDYDKEQWKKLERYIWAPQKREP